MPFDPDSSVQVQGITDEELAALQRAGQAGAGLAPSIDEMKYATQVEPKTIMAGRGVRVQPYEDIVTPAITEGLLPMLYGAGKGTVSALAGIPGEINDAFKWVRDQGSYSQAVGQGNDIPNIISNTLENLPAPKNTEQIYNSFNTTGKPTEDYGRMMGQNIVANLMFPQAPKAIRATKDLPIGLAIKNKGGNWIDSSLSAFDQFKKPIREESYLNQIRNDILDGVQQPESLQTALRGNAQNGAINNWIDSKLKKYVKNEMGTPTDPVRELADQGITHLPNIEGINPNYAPSMEDVKVQRAAANMPLQGFASAPLGKHWENLTDQAIRNRSAGMRVKQGESTTAFPQMKRALEENPWLKTVEPTTPVHDANGFVNDLEFRHLIDELKNSIAHNSDLPAHLRLKPETLDKMTVPHAVKHVAKINKYRAEQMAKAAKEDLSNFPVVHEGGNGYNIHELKLPESKELPAGFKVEKHLTKDFYLVRDSNGADVGAVGKTPEEATHAFNTPHYLLDKALKNEGEQMGHCVGGYTDSVADGHSRIFSLRDEKGGAHATVEATPKILDYNPKYIPQDVQDEIAKYAHSETIKAGYPENTQGYWNHHTGVEIQEGTKYLNNHPVMDIKQIKGKGNGEVSDKYRNYIKNWLNKESDKINYVNDLQNVGLHDLKNGLVRQENLDKRLAEGFKSGQLKRFSSDEEVRDFMNKPNREQNLAKFLEPSVDKNIWYHTSNNPEIANSTIKPNVPNMGEHSSISLTATPESASSFDPKFKSFEKNPEHVENKAIYPVHVQVEKPFDYNNPEHFKELENYFHNNYNEIDTDQFIDELKYFKQQIKRHPELDTWETMESYPVQKAIRDLGYDGFYSQEDRNKNLAVFSSNQIKSKHGNEGTYDVKNHLMHKKTGGRVKMSEGGEPPKLTPYEQFKIENAERIRQGQQDIANRNKYDPYKGSDKPIPTSKGMSGVSGGDGLLKNEISAKNPVYKKGGKIPSIDEMRLTILRNK